MSCDVLHRLAWIHNRAHPYIPYYNRRLPCPVQRPVWRRYLVSVDVLRLMVCPLVWCKRCIGGLCDCCIVCVGIWRINGNASVKPCKRFWRCGGIICMDNRRTAVNACAWLIRRRAKIKALHHQQAQGKRKARPFLTGWNAFYLDALNSAEKNQKKNRSADKIIFASPLTLRTTQTARPQDQEAS